jgi:hypothetical protein
MRTSTCLSLFCAGLLAAAAPAASQTTVLAPGGVTYRVVKGTCATLAVCPDTTTAANPALALEWEVPGVVTKRVLVPGTDDAAAEGYPSLAVDRPHGHAYLVWASTGAAESALRLARFDRVDWGNVVEVAAGAASLERAPRLAVTHDRYSRLLADGSLVEQTRLVLHLVWWEGNAYDGVPLYAPVVVEDGELLAEWEALHLGDLLGPADGVLEFPAGFAQTPQIRAVGTGARAVIAFADPSGGRIGTVDVDVVDGGVVSFADHAREAVLAVAEANPTASVEAVAGLATPRVAELAQRLLPARVGQLLASEFVAEVASGSGGLTAAVDSAREVVLDIGRRSGDGIQLATGEARAVIIVIGRRAAAATAGGDEGSHLARLGQVVAAPLPAVPERAVRLLTSDCGTQVAAAWLVEGAVKYRSLESGAWSDIRTVTLVGEVTREKAFELIQQQLQQQAE